MKATPKDSKKKPAACDMPKKGMMKPKVAC